MNTAEKLRKMAEYDPLRRAILTDAADELDALTTQLQAAQTTIAAIRVQARRPFTEHLDIGRQIGGILSPANPSTTPKETR